MVADGRRPAAGTRPSGQPHARAALALLPADARARRRSRRRLVSQFVEPRTDTGEGGPAAGEHYRAVCQSAPPAPLAGSRGFAHPQTEAVIGRPGVVEAATAHIRTL